MPIRYIVPKITGALMLIIGAAFLIYNIGKMDHQAQSEDQEVGRAPSNLQRKNHFALGKPNQTLQIEIQEIPVEGFHGTRLAATVTLKKPVDGPIQMTWDIPPTVQIVSGKKDFWIHSLEVGQSHYSEIDLAGLLDSEERQNAILSAKAEISGTSVGAEAVFSSHITGPDLVVRKRIPASVDSALSAQAQSPVKMKPNGKPYMRNTEGKPRLHY